VEVVKPQLRISLDSRDYQEVRVYLSHSSSCQEFRVKVINMILLCSNSSIRLLMVQDSQTISNMEVRLQALKTNHQTMVQPEE
jgi:tryptophan 2,3-dioxygenase